MEKSPDNQSNENKQIKTDQNSENFNDNKTVIVNGKELANPNARTGNKALLIIFIISIIFPLSIFGFAIFQNLSEDRIITSVQDQNTKIFNNPKDTSNQNSNNKSGGTSTDKSCDAAYQLQPSECKGYTTSSSGVVNKGWKKYIINNHNFSFEYPSHLQDYAGNPVDDYIIFDAAIYPPDDNDGVIKLSSSIEVNLRTKSYLKSNYEAIILNTQFGPVDAKYSVSTHEITDDGMKYIYEFRYNGIYYYFRLFNTSDKDKIMTADEFKKLVESSSIKT